MDHGILRIHLYEDPSAKTLDVREIGRYLQDKLSKIQLDIRKPLIASDSDQELDRLAWRLASMRVRNPMDPLFRPQPLPGELEFERKFLRHPELRIPGVLYDGLELQALAWELISAHERNLSHLHLVFTNRLFGTWDPSDGRYHARVSIYGFPCLISTTGIVEAPAKPREYYMLKRRYAALGTVFLEELKHKFQGKFLDYDDPRLTQVIKGYAMQAVFHHLLLDPFCCDKRCRLYNAHWQQEMLEAQLSQPEFCEKHSRMLAELSRSQS